MKKNIIYNSLSELKNEQNFLYDFYFSKNPETNTNLGVNELPRFRLKNINENNSITEVPIDNFVYQFSGHGDKSTGLKDTYNFKNKYFYNRTYCSQIMCQLKTNDFEGIGTLFPIFFFGSKLDVWKSINLKKIRLKLELFNTKNSQINFSNTTKNLFKILLWVTTDINEVTDILPQKIENQGISKTQVPKDFLPNPSQRTNVISSKYIINLKNLGVVPANNSNSRKYIIHYELDSNILLENIQKNTNILIGINFNNEVILKQKLDKVNMKLTSYITINDNLNSPLTDNF